MSTRSDRGLSEDPLPLSGFSVLQVGGGWFPEDAGGLERVFHALWQHLPAVGVEPTGLVVADTLAKTVAPGGMAAFASPTAPVWKRALALRQAARQALVQAGPDLVATHFALYALPVLDLVRDRPLVVHFHGPWAAEGEAEGGGGLAARLKVLAERLVYGRATRCVVLSEAFRDLLHTRYGVPLDRIRIVPGGVDAHQFDTGFSRADARHRLGWPTDRPLVLSVRRLARRMGLENLLEATRRVREVVPDVLVLVAGKGPLEPTLRRAIRSQGLEEHVRMLGFVPDEDLPLAYRAADLSVVPTVALEGFGLITLESMAAGTPALVTPVGGLPETVRPLDGALVLESHHPEALAQGLIEALTGRRHLPSPEACQAHVQARHAWPVIAAQTRRVYEEALRA